MNRYNKSLFHLLSFVLLCPLFLQSVTAQFYVDYNSDARAIYKEIINLRLNTVPSKLDSFKLKHPHNLARIHLENYLDFFTLFINEEEEQFKALKKNKSIRIKEIEEKLKDEDAHKRFLIAEINLQWALTRSKFGELFKASREIYTSYNLLTLNEKEFPDFVLNKKSLSILHSLVETITIPGFFKVLLGLEGSVDLAKAEIDEVIESSSQNIFIEESDAIKAFILFYQANERKEAWHFIQSSSLNEKESLLATFLKAKFAQRIGRNDKAITILENRPTDSGYSTFSYLDYQYGLSLLRKMDPRAKIYLTKFTDNFKGKHFIKEAYQKLAWSALVFDNDSIEYYRFLSLANRLGDDLVDDDKQALTESKSKKLPNVSLLKARLLFDGGYYNEAVTLLNSLNAKNLIDTKYYVEYIYRLGRSYQMIDELDEAKTYLKEVLVSDVNDKSYYDCNAALQLGIIAENMANYSIARQYFETCLSINPKSYKRSLHQKAKSGLQRLNR